MNTPVATSPAKPSLLQQFQDSLKAGDVAAALAEGLIGKDAVIEGPVSYTHLKLPTILLV